MEEILLKINENLENINKRLINIEEKVDKLENKLDKEIIKECQKKQMGMLYCMKLSY